MTGNIYKAVQAAEKAYWDALDATGNSFDEMKEAITAAIPHLPLGFEVKQLEWDKYDACDAGLARYSIYGGIGQKFTCVVYPFNSQKIRLSVDVPMQEAKAAAQADFERRILSCIVTKPVDVAAVRRQALEEAKAIAFDTSENGQYMGNGDCGENSIYQQGAREVYGAICDHIESAPSAEPAQGDHIADVGKMVEAESLKGQQHDN